jgi:Dolichyl-phosphate-mannose-protein mannosyltransferase
MASYKQAPGQERQGQNFQVGQGQPWQPGSPQPPANFAQMQYSPSPHTPGTGQPIMQQQSYGSPAPAGAPPQQYGAVPPVASNNVGVHPPQGPGYPSGPNTPPGMQPAPGQGYQRGPEVINGNVILHRTADFFLRTAYRPDRRSGAPSQVPGAPMPTFRAKPPASMESRETRHMPSIEPINPIHPRRTVFPLWSEVLLIIFGLFCTLLSHAYNMFNFPRYELDEGTYMSSAWAILHGKIEPYAYGYGHPPAGWIQIAALVQLLGGFFTFGNALNTGRVIMLLYALGCALLVYLIVRRLGGSRTTSFLALIIFSLSPLSIIYQRQIYLDNIATFWLLMSVYFVVTGNSRLKFIVLGALSFSISVLSKETFLLFLPVMIYALWLHTTKFQRKFALVAFVYSAVALTSSFVLLAVLKGELFPTGWLPGDTHQHLSMIGTYLGQVSRGQNEGSIATSWMVWTNTDPLFMVLSIAPVIFNLIMGWWNRKQLLLSLLAISIWMLLIRGGVVFGFYILPLIPLAAMNAAVAINNITDWIGKVVHFDLVRSMLTLGVALALIPYFIQPASFPFVQHPTSVQTDAMKWIGAHVPRNDFVVISTYLYVDLHEPGGVGVGNGPIYKNAEVYINVATDPELFNGKLQGNGDRIDYIVADSAMEQYINTQIPKGTPGYILKLAFDNSKEVAEFKTPEFGTDFNIKVYQVQHKGHALTAYQATPTQAGAGAVAVATSPVDRRMYALS